MHIPVNRKGIVASTKLLTDPNSNQPYGVETVYKLIHRIPLSALTRNKKPLTVRQAEQFKEDIKHYVAVSLVGVRHSGLIVKINLNAMKQSKTAFIRGQLLINPNANEKALTEQFKRLEANVTVEMRVKGVNDSVFFDTLASVSKGLTKFLAPYKTA